MDLMKNSSAKRPRPADPSQAAAPQKARKKAGCPYLSWQTQEIYRGAVLSKVYDIEEELKLGQQLEACAYYGTRKAISLAHVGA